MSRRIHAATSGDFQRLPPYLSTLTVPIQRGHCLCSSETYSLRHTVQLQLRGVAEGKETLKPYRNNTTRSEIPQSKQACAAHHDL